MKTVKGEFWNKESAYKAMSDIKKYCLSVKIETGTQLRNDIRSSYLSEFQRRHDFITSGTPYFMNTIGIPTMNSFNWGSFTSDIGYSPDLNEDFPPLSESNITIIKAEVDDENEPKVKRRLYSHGALSVSS